LPQLGAQAAFQAGLPSAILDVASPLAHWFLPEPDINAIVSGTMDATSAALRQSEQQRANQDYTDRISKLINDTLLMQTHNATLPPFPR
jgi:hypothetical protein